MLFETLLRISKKYVPKMYEDIKGGYVIDIRGSEKKPHGKPISIDTIMMPYRVTAIEDDDICFVFNDLKDNQFGCDYPRRYAQISPMIVRDEDGTLTEYNRFYVVSVGLIQKVLYDKELESYIISGQHGKRVFDLKNGHQEELSEIINNHELNKKDKEINNILHALYAIDNIKDFMDESSFKKV